MAVPSASDTRLAVRSSLGLHGKQKLAIWLADGKLIIEKIETVKADLKADFKQLRDQGVSLSEELIEERRTEAQHEHDTSA